MTDYRIFVGAFPESELAREIQAVREQYDPKTARITSPHVTLAGTYWRSGPPTPQNEARAVEQLQQLAGRVQAFDLALGGVRSFSGDSPRTGGRPGVYPIVYLGVEITPGLLAARRALLDVLGPDKHDTFAPHLTLAMRLDRPHAQAMMDELASTRWAAETFRVPIRELRLMQRSPQDPAWRCISVVKL
jgi:2'-5' RNA ligase